MIDTLQEELIPLTAAAKHLPPKKTGKRVHRTTLLRWALKGFGGVRLETVRVGGSRYTSIEALHRFVREVSHGKQVVGCAEPISARPPEYQGRSNAAVNRRLDQILNRSSNSQPEER